MITPLGQRQIWQTANVEAVRQAQELSEHIQREEVRKKVADDNAAEEQEGVRVIPRADPMRAEERKERQRQEHGGKGKEDQEEQEDLLEGQLAGQAAGQYDGLLEDLVDLVEQGELLHGEAARVTSEAKKPSEPKPVPHHLDFLA